MSTITVEMFVGSDNTTGHVDRDTLYRVLDARHTAWTVSDAVGSWEGTREESVRVILSDKRKRVMRTMATLRDALDQDAIAYREISAMQLVTRS